MSSTFKKMADPANLIGMADPANLIGKVVDKIKGKSGGSAAPTAADDLQPEETKQVDTRMPGEATPYEAGQVTQTQWFKRKRRDAANDLLGS